MESIAKEETQAPQKYRVAIPEWVEDDGIAKMIGFELEKIGYEPILFLFDHAIPKDINYLLTFGPYNRILPIWQSNARLPVMQRPITIHWNTEGMPDLRVPSPVLRALGSIRSRLGRMGDSGSTIEKFLYSTRLVSHLDQAFKRYRYHGDYAYAFQMGWLNVLADTSHIYSQLRTKIGMPTLYAPWGASQRWYENLGLERDIDVLWMGKRGSQRRSRILDLVCRELKRKGLNVYIADSEEKPFIFGEERTRYLNRTKVSLNITRTWYDDNFSRFTMACPNRSLLVSEPILPHCIELKEGIHYVSAKVEDLANTIIYYLEHEDERQQIVDNAYNLMMSELKFENSLRKMFNVARS